LLRKIHFLTKKKEEASNWDGERRRFKLFALRLLLPPPLFLAHLVWSPVASLVAVELKAAPA
jgi:hypothetical protein